MCRKSEILSGQSRNPIIVYPREPDVNPRAEQIETTCARMLLRRSSFVGGDGATESVTCSSGDDGGLVTQGIIWCYKRTRILWCYYQQQLLANNINNNYKKETEKESEDTITLTHTNIRENCLQSGALTGATETNERKQHETTEGVVWWVWCKGRKDGRVTRG